MGCYPQRRAFRFILFPLAPVTVSYTHLDVYKRQQIWIENSGTICAETSLNSYRFLMGSLISILLLFVTRIADLRLSLIHI